MPIGISCPLTYTSISRAFLRNPNKYPDPDNFRPERWLEPGWPTYQEPLTQYPTIKGFTSFGWGQRQCLGQTLTHDELIVACGALAWAFNLTAKTDPITGSKLPVPLNKSNSLLIIKPDPFQMAFEPRSEKRREEALRIWAEAEAKDRLKRAQFLLGGRNSEPINIIPDKTGFMDGKGYEDLLQDVPDLDFRRERDRMPTSRSLDKLEQLKRDILIQLKSVPELQRAGNKH